MTPPGMSVDHEMSYNDLDYLASYVPVSDPLFETTYEYTLDRNTKVVSTADGNITYYYENEGVSGPNAAGRLAFVELGDPADVLGVTYYPETARLAALDYEVDLTFAWDGPFLTNETSSLEEAVQGATASVENTYGGYLRNSSKILSNTVDGISVTIPYLYQFGGAMTNAGDAVLNRDQKTGLLTGTALSGITSTVSYNGYGEIDMESYAGPGGSIVSFDYSGNDVSRDGLGRIVRKSETYGGLSKTFAYTYDDADRLTDVYVFDNGSPNPAEWYEYEYDNDALPVGNGNRTEYVRHIDNDADGTWDETESTTGTYDLQDRLVTYGTATYTYTDGGMLASKIDGSAETDYHYDLMGNLKGVNLPDGRTIDYMVDGLGRRIWRKENGVLVKGYVYADALNPIAELNGDGETESVFVYGSKSNVPDYLMKPASGSWEQYRIISDQVGSVRLVVRATDGTVVQEMDYDPFGQVTKDTNPGFQPFGFAGGLYDADTGLVRFGARDYDADTGRWTAKDPILFWGGDTNLYGYVMMDPVNLLDPSGLVPFWAEIAEDLCGTVAGVSGVGLAAGLFGGPIAWGVLFGGAVIVGGIEIWKATEMGDPIDAAKGKFEPVVKERDQFKNDLDKIDEELDRF